MKNVMLNINGSNSLFLFFILSSTLLIKQKLENVDHFSFREVSISETEKELRELNSNKILFKKDDQIKAKNYRPLSVLPGVSNFLKD